MNNIELFNFHRELRDNIMEHKLKDQSHYDFLATLSQRDQLAVLAWEFDFQVFFLSMNLWHNSNWDLCNNMFINVLTPYMTRYKLIANFISIVHKMDYVVYYIDDIEKEKKLENLSLEYHKIRNEFMNIIHDILLKSCVQL